jgi:uncharacterized protein with FMN-binding domain
LKAIHFFLKKLKKIYKNPIKNDIRTIIICNGGTMKKISLFMILLLMIISFYACGTTESAGSSGTQLFLPGTYEGNGDGYFGLVNVAVTVTENAITGIEILSHVDTDGIGTIVFEELTQTIIYTNSSDVDVIAGATGSSEGFIAAVNDALSQATK